MSTTKLLLVVTFMAALLSLSACSVGQASGTLGQLQAVASTCPKEHIAAYVADDVSANDRSAALTAQRLQEIKALATFTAACGGYLEVTAFSASDTATRVIYSGQLEPFGATLTSRLLKVPSLVESAMQTITTALPRASAELPANATDVLAQLTLVAQYMEQIGPGYRFYGQVLTSGLQSTGVLVTNVNLSQAAALDLANRVAVPSLPAAALTISGIGLVASGPPAPSGYVAALLAFYHRVCLRTRASSCTVTVNPIIRGS
jgi:hypothetical protein